MLKKLGPYARPYSKWIAVGVLCSAAEAIFELLIPLVMADIVNIGIETANQNYILQKGLLMMGMAVISLCFGLGAAASSSVAGQGFGAELRRAEYEHIQDFAFSNIEKFSTASLVTRLTNDVNNMQMTLMMGMRLLVRAPVMLVAALVLSIRLSRDLSNVFLVVIPLLLIVIVLILTKAGPLFRSLQERTDALNLVVQENLTGIRVVKSFVREDYEEEKFAKRNGDLKESSMRAFGMVVINMPVMMLVVYSTIIAVMWFGGKMVYAGTLPVGDLTAFFTYITQILMSLMMVSMMFMMMTRSIACTKRIVEVLDERPAITDDSAKADAAVKDGSWFSDLESYTADQFAGRDFWIALRLRFLKLTGQKESNGVYLCSGDYLMEPPADPPQDSRNVEAINAFAARHTDLRLNMAVIPNAACILADKLPKNALVRDQSADLTALAGSLQGISFLDVSAALSAHTDEQLYYRTDHHWTSLGARYAFEAMAAQLGISQPIQNYDTYTVSTTFEGTLASRSGSHAAYDTVELYVPQTDVEYYVSYGDAAETSATIYDRSALDQKDKYTVFFGGNYPRVDVYTTAETGKTLLLFKDSYANCLMQFLYPYYDHIILIDPRYYYDNVESVISREQVTDVLFLYNANTYFEDTSLADVLNVSEN